MVVPVAVVEKMCQQVVVFVVVEDVVAVAEAAVGAAGEGVAVVVEKAVAVADSLMVVGAVEVVADVGGEQETAVVEVVEAYETVVHVVVVW